MRGNRSEGWWLAGWSYHKDDEGCCRAFWFKDGSYLALTRDWFLDFENPEAGSLRSYLAEAYGIQEFHDKPPPPHGHRAGQ